MRLQYFEDTDTLYIEFKAAEITDTRDLDEDTLLDLHAAGNVCALTVEHASERTDIHQFTVEGLAT